MTVLKQKNTWIWLTQYSEMFTKYKLIKHKPLTTFGDNAGDIGLHTCTNSFIT